MKKRKLRKDKHKNEQISSNDIANQPCMSEGEKKKDGLVDILYFGVMEDPERMKLNPDTRYIQQIDRFIPEGVMPLYYWISELSMSTEPFIKVLISRAEWSSLWISFDPEGMNRNPPQQNTFGLFNRFAIVAMDKDEDFRSLTNDERATALDLFSTWFVFRKTWVDAICGYYKKFGYI